MKNFIALYYIFLILMLGLSSCGKKKQAEVTRSNANALIHETSPYLLQHANNPVDWVPWSMEALNQAKSEGKLILVSIGYSSCHWCHVMESETFEDQQVADFMNENFINIKVDREERPDVDNVYMTALQLITGSGGWPLNVITLPNGNPLYGGTYHTKEEWIQVLLDVNKFFTDEPEKAVQYGKMLAQGIQDMNKIVLVSNITENNAENLAVSVDNWKSKWDLDWGGDRGDEKFMMPANLNFLLNYAAVSNNQEYKVHIQNTLNKMALGGIYDQVRGGFFRYSTDIYWKVPHFEKMLYDNAQMLSLYANAFKEFKEEEYREIIVGICDFLEREMKNPYGGYYAALDADTDGIEGKYYLWEEDELKTVMGDDYGLSADYFSITSQRQSDDTSFVLSREGSDKDFAIQHGISEHEFSALKSKWKNDLLKARQNRIPPRKDDKIITSWNALLMIGFLDAYAALGDETYLNKSIEILDFLQTHSFDENHLIHSYKEGGSHVSGFLEDYAFLIEALIKLYGFTGNQDHLDIAMSLNDVVLKSFSDDATGMFKFSQHEELISTLIPTHDGVLPSSNASMALNLFQLGHLLGNKGYIDRTEKMLASMIPNVLTDGQAYGKWNQLLMHISHPFHEVAVVGENSKALVKSLNKVHLSNTLIVGSETENELPLFKNRFEKGKTLIYVCINNTCKLPVALPEQAIDIIKAAYEKK
ncbi:MAG TPA: thioredoxin domain-containing protein [Lunatimonas sp.]|nr:thioredoxin domain-containing protein [Lunatimonas sp.]